MAFLDELSDKLLNTGKTAVNKAKEVADITKLKTEIISEESKIKSAYAEIGKLCYEKAEGEIDPDFQPLFEKIAVSKAAIAENKAEIQRLKGTSVCPECGAEVADKAQFCSSCGAPVPQKKDEPVEDACECGAGEREQTEEACGCEEGGKTEDSCGCEEGSKAEDSCSCGCGEDDRA